MGMRPMMSKGFGRGCGGGGFGPVFQGIRGGGRGSSFHRKAYQRARSSVERFFRWLKGGFRRRLSAFQAFVLLACFLIAWKILR